jgi:hypothetical protein
LTYNTNGTEDYEDDTLIKIEKKSWKAFLF